MSQITQINLNTLLDKFCRICSKIINDHLSLIPIFNNEQLSAPPISIIENFHNNNFQILKDDGLPQHICKNCLQEFNQANLLIKKCEKSQNILQEQFQKLTELHDFFDIKPLEEDAYTIIEYKLEDGVEEENIDDHHHDDEEIIDNDNINNDNINNDDNTNDDDDSNIEIVYEAEFLDYNDDIKVQNMDHDNDDEIIDENENQQEENKANIINYDDNEIDNQQNLIKPYTCFICSRSFRTISIRDKHIALNICTKTNNHINEISNNNIKIEEYNEFDDYDDGENNDNTDNNDEEILFNDTKSITQDVIKRNNYHKYHCLQCYHSFSNFKDFMEHKKTHNREKKVPQTKRIFLCDICGKDFSKKQSLEDHENVHKGIRPYTCHLCDKSFTFKQILKSHLSKHGENSTYKCEVCNKTFTSKQYYNEHKKRHETGVLLPNCDKLYKCPHCPKSFKFLSTLTSHCSFHSKPTESKYHCTDCGAIFKRSDHLKEHINAVHLNLKPFSCDLCGKKFVTGAHRNAHKRKFHSGKRFQCDICDKDFSLNTSLTRHKRIHTGEKRYKCEICNESFMAIYQIEKHLETHKIDENAKNVLISQTYADIQQGPVVADCVVIV